MIACSGNLAEQTFVALDTETTGLSWRTCKLLEVAAIRFDLAGNVLGKYVQLIDPQCDIPYAATAVHGITNEMVAGMPTIDLVLPEFFAFLEACNSIVVIHNAPFDLGFLREASRRVGNRCPGHSVIDTLGLARRRIRELRSHRLDMLITYFGLGECAEHRALGDAEMLRRIFIEMLRRSPAVETMADLLMCAKLRTFEPEISRQVRRFVPRW